jgi:hypothetical protein
MKSYSARTALTEHMLEGHSVSGMEAMLLFGVRNPNAHFSTLRKRGFLIQSQTVSLAKVVRRMNTFSKFEPPPELPLRDLSMTEYWISK